MAESKRAKKPAREKDKTATGDKVRKAAKRSKTVALAEEVKALKVSLNDFENRHLRLRAEFDNYRKRKEREISRLLKYEGEEVIKSFLPVVDDLERMMQSVDGEEPRSIRSFVEGIGLIVEKLRKRLRDVGAEPFDSVGEKFDPELHEAMMVQQSDDHDEGTIIQEFERGYRFKDKVIRHARVVVSK